MSPEELLAKHDRLKNHRYRSGTGFGDAYERQHFNDLESLYDNITGYVRENRIRDSWVHKYLGQARLMLATITHGSSADSALSAMHTVIQKLQRLTRLHRALDAVMDRVSVK